MTYYNFWNATANTGTVTISGNNTFNDFKIDAGRSTVFTAFTINTVSSFTAVGTAGNVITLTSSTNGQRYYLKDTSGINTCDYLSLRDCGVTGGATWTAGANTTYVSGNIGWDTNPAVNRYWVTGGNGYWDDTSNWATSSGGASGAAVPIGENVYFDANSGNGDIFMSRSSGLNLNANNFDCTGFTGTLIGSSSFRIYGDFKLVSGLTNLMNPVITINTNGSSKNFTTGTKTLLDTLTFDTVSDTVTLQDALVSNSTGTLTTGVLDANNKNITFTTFSSTNANTRTLTMGSGTWELTGTGTVWSFATITGLTLNQNTSTVKLTDATSQTKTFAGGGEAYYNIWMT